MVLAYIISIKYLHNFSWSDEHGITWALTERFVLANVGEPLTKPPHKREVR
jgi:hypothetical protein